MKEQKEEEQVEDLTGAVTEVEHSSLSDEDLEDVAGGLAPDKCADGKC